MNFQRHSVFNSSVVWSCSSLAMTFKAILSKPCLYLALYNHNLTTVMNNVWAIHDMHQVAGTELVATVNWCQYKEPLRKEKKQSPMLLRRESGACNEYFIGLSLIGCQFSIAGLRGPIFNHFCNARAICSVRRGLSGPFLLSTTYRQNMLEMFTLLPVSQNNA